MTNELHTPPLFTMIVTYGVRHVVNNWDGVTLCNMRYVSEELEVFDGNAALCFTCSNHLDDILR